MFSGIVFAYPYLLLLLVIIPLIAVWYGLKHNGFYPEISVSRTDSFEKAKKTFRQNIIHSPIILRLLALTLIIVALARPQTSNNTQDISVEGIDIVIAQDISGSMLAEDFRPNRLEAAKDVAVEFINERSNDRIGLVAFSGEAFTMCPLTTNHASLINFLQSLKSGMIDDGTALGDGLATAVNRLSYSKAISKVVILLTDGINNRGSIDPMTAAEIAKLYGIRVYTIGVGTQGMAPYPFDTPFGIQYQNMEVQIDEPLLKDIAATTNGKYFRATNKEKLSEIYKEIDKLEKSKIDVAEYRHKKEEFLLFLFIAFGLLLLEFVLRNTILKRIP
jgi:Ca-activated chloride channel family protein